MLFVELLEQLGLSRKDIQMTINEPFSTLCQKEVEDISLSAQAVTKNCIFAAVKGTQKDGADFIDTAVQNGAIAVLTDRSNIQAPVPLIVVDNVAHAAARAADLLYPTPNLKKIAVTGTNGKTSTVYFVREILNSIGYCAASLGTLGIESPVLKTGGSMTTPDCVTLHRSLKKLADKGVEFVAMEASSHGLAQGRLDGISFLGSGFTNLTRDHLDYHGTMENYFAAKIRLFSERTDLNGTVVLNADVPEFQTLEAIAQKRNIRVFSYGIKGKTLRLISQRSTPGGQDVVFNVLGKKYAVSLNVFGDFQVMNILCSAGLCLAAGIPVKQVMNALPQLKAPEGRMEMVVQINSARVFVDYAHTPDALERVLKSLRAHTDKRLICVFGCGGNRDTGKRAQMGEIASRLADVVYVTDDNPRFENPAVIRNAILEACPKGIECRSRIEALYLALHDLQRGDVCVVCGKGHETGQTVSGMVYHYNDKTEITAQSAAFEKEVLWSGAELSMALNTKVPVTVEATGVSIDTRTLKAGDLFIALTGKNTDGHQYVKTALDKGAAACMTTHLLPDVLPEKQIVVADTVDGLEALARFSRMRSEAVFVGITGSSGKTTTKEMLKTVLSEQGSTFATPGNLNNQLGVPLVLVNLSKKTEYAVIEMGMNHFGEMSCLSDLVRPHHTVITMIGGAHRAYFKSDIEIAKAKSEIYEFADADGTAIINAESLCSSYLIEAARKRGIRHIVLFGSKPGADFKLIKCEVDSQKTTVTVRWLGTEYTYDLHFVGRHFALDSLAVLAAVDAVGASVEKAMKDIQKAYPVAGRGAVEEITVEGRGILLIDDTYNANPISMAASIQTLGAYQNTRRIAVLGDMLELGEMSAVFHKNLTKVLIENKIDKIFTVGSEMLSLFLALPPEMQGGSALKAEEIIPVLKKELQTGDTVLVKASNSMGLKKIIDSLKGKE